MFVDKAQVHIQAGDGGDGLVSFRHEKFIDKGGPDGGDGGRGGNIVFLASRNQNTLATFRYQKELVAPSGNGGDSNRKRGRSGGDLVVSVPVGTIVTNQAGEIVADLKVDGLEVVIAAGGRGGFGNAHFVSSTRQAPRVAEKGEPGEVIEATLELKMIADVGLVGLPNAGKSTFLASVSNARPEIANYPFTTLRPYLGVVDINSDSSLLMADIPGLIEGASEGKGLGDEFLRHVERTQVLLHLIDIYSNDVVADYRTIQKELAAYSVDLSKKHQLVALSKIDGLDDEIVNDKLSELQAVVPAETPLMAVSSQSKHGLKEILYELLHMVQSARSDAAEAAEAAEGPEAGVPVLRLSPLAKSWQVVKTDEGYVVTGHKIEKFALRTNFGDFHSEQRLRDIMKKMGIMHELVRKGIEPGNTIYVGRSGLHHLEY